MRLVGHIDSDCFYVSCERVRRRSLRGIPVGVLGNQGACVIALSYELKKAGLKVGMPIWDAKPISPEAVSSKEILSGTRFFLENFYPPFEKLAPPLSTTR